ncbi:MAG TPA: efflux RND transporter periplasmic adaptor subunit, partial [Xanthobacteraceae bacterium]|nr:efflux RND transporter periplasmic adaptor subunit [Xanthobacteraceae bacterium]
MPTVFCCGGSLAQNALPPAVSVQPVVSRQVTETGDFVGRVAALNKVDIVARVTGFIGKRNFTEGQMVKTGDLLFRIEPDTYKAAVDQQAANLAKTKATEVNANLQLQRAQALVKNQNVPQATVDELAAAEQSAQADILQAQALLEQAKINLSYTEIVSPIDGRIGIARYTVGNLVSPSTGVLATIVSQDPIYVTFQASEADVVEYRRHVAASADKDPHVVVHIRLPDGSIYSHPGLTNFLDVQVQADT